MHPLYDIRSLGGGGTGRAPGSHPSCWRGAVRPALARAVSCSGPLWAPRGADPNTMSCSSCPQTPAIRAPIYGRQAPLAAADRDERQGATSGGGVGVGLREGGIK